MNDWESKLMTAVALVCIAVGLAIVVGPGTLIAFGVFLILFDETSEQYKRRREARRLEHWRKTGEKDLPRRLP